MEWNWGYLWIIGFAVGMPVYVFSSYYAATKETKRKERAAAQWQRLD